MAKVNILKIIALLEEEGKDVKKLKKFLIDIYSLNNKHHSEFVSLYNHALVFHVCSGESYLCELSFFFTHPRYDSYFEPTAISRKDLGKSHPDLLRLIDSLPKKEGINA